MKNFEISNQVINDLYFSSIVSFYGPLVVMIFAYYRIFRAALEHERSLKKGVKQISNGSAQNSNGQEVTLRIHRGGGRQNGSALEYVYRVRLERPTSQIDRLLKNELVK